MGLNLVDLDDRTRQYMLEEVDRDVAAGTLYYGKRLTEEGARRYPELLRAAIRDGSDSTLAAELGRPGILAERETSRSKTGRVYEKSVPYDANITLAEGEFNRFYLRGVARRAIDQRAEQLVVYRSKEVANARSASAAMVGTSIDPVRLLDDLRSHQGVDTALGLPPGPNSGLSARLPD